MTPINDLDRWIGQPQQNTPATSYTPAPIERYIMDHLSSLNLDNGRDRLASEEGANWHLNTSAACDIWKRPELTSDTNHAQMEAFRKELREYYKIVNDREPVPDVRRSFDGSAAVQERACEVLEVHSAGLKGIFVSGQLSMTKSGFVEPLLPPMRHPDFCFNRTGETIMTLEYLVHDFRSMCRKMKKHSRVVLIDMGASLSFGQDANGRVNSPALYLAGTFEKFGMPFDHIYAFEINQEDPKVVMDRIPPKLMAAFHWINVGVSTDRDSKLNPLRLLLDNYNADDVIVVKMDIDNAKDDLELPLAQQILDDPQLSLLIDHFYFEHHVHMTELAGNWNRGMRGSVQQSLELFSKLRESGVAAHFWV